MLTIFEENGDVYKWIKGEDDFPRRIPELTGANIRSVCCGQNASFAIAVYRICGQHYLGAGHTENQK
jgi:hypothetical protein